MSEYIVSARKYRPDSFESLIGQDNIARTLKNSIQRGQLAHAYLFCGPRGVGKTSAARIFAKTINCSNPGPDMEPCGKCESCLSFAEGRSYCIHELDAASNNGVDDIKALMDQVQIPPQVGRYSVYIIDEVHMLSQAAFNAFLKTLEEPPAHAIFILATTEKHKIIPTILSRCQTYDFNRIGIPDIVRNLQSIALKEGIAIDDKSLHVIAQKADGAMRDALTIFDQTVAFCGTDIKYGDVIRNLNVLDYEYSFRLVDAFLRKDHATALLIFDEILSKGFNALYFISSLGSHLRDLMVSRTGGMESLLDFPDSLLARYREQAGRCPMKFLFDSLTIVSQCEAGYRAATNQRLHIEYALMRLAFLGGVPEQEAAVAPAPAVKAPEPVKALEPVKASEPVKAPEPAKAPAPANIPDVVKTPEPAEVPGPAAVASVPSASDALDIDLDFDSFAPELAVPAAPAVEKKPSRRKAAKTGSSLSLAALMTDGEEPAAAPAETPVTVSETPLPGDDVLETGWRQLASMQNQPRLANALATARLEFREEGGVKNIDFYVTNEAQKRWIEERILRNLEAQYQKLMGCDRLRLNPTVQPEDQKEVIYTPVEKAQDLMNRNKEVAVFMADFGLDIK